MTIRTGTRLVQILSQSLNLGRGSREPISPTLNSRMISIVAGKVRASYDRMKTPLGEDGFGGVDR